MKRLGTFYENKLLWQVIKGEPSEKVLRFMLENYKFEVKYITKLVFLELLLEGW